MKRRFHFVADPATVAPRAREVLARVPAGLADKSALLAALARVLRLPSYFGGNWDALDECLRDLSWIDADRVLLVHEDLPLAADPDGRRTYLEILARAAAIEATFPASVKREVQSSSGQ